MIAVRKRSQYMSEVAIETKNTLIKNDVKQPEFDQSSYIGRFMRCFTMIDPRLTLYSENDVLTAKNDINNLAISQNMDSNEFKWKRRIIDNNVHPQTGEVIHPLATMASFLVLNVPICAGMLFTTPTFANQFLWQWINQTYNAIFNYANGNKSKENLSQLEIDAKRNQMLQAYFAACTVSVGLSISLNELVKRVKCNPSLKKGLGIAVPFVAVASAGFANAVLMRSNELSEGVPVRDDRGEMLGKSQIAAEKILFGQVGVSRIALAFPILVLPPVIMNAIKSKVKLVGVANKLVELTVLTACLGFAFPAAVALFPQKVTLNAQDLEENFRTMPNGQPRGAVFADKGV